MPIMRKKQTYRYREQTSGYQFREKSGEGGEEGQIVRDKIDYKDILDSMWNTGSVLQLKREYKL